ncbi:MAG: hypothetical protein DRQ88_07275 [Epsilonproteobacteria bacterium]|nr:MAG: hypothetical protein DRQ89_03140 [Campylobacterota bacterium]RLA66283.1 MAG: hypothetical protein DRQ88_07275 [Campylobacterota bacterium]
MKKLLILFCLFSHPAQAWLIVEGNVGYGISNEWEKENYADVQYDGMVVNGRLGVKVFNFLIFGGEYSWSDNYFEYMDNSSGIGYKIPSPRTDYGVFAGIDLPIMLRFWASYYIQSELKMDNLNGTKLNGFGYGAGVGWTFLPFVSINGEYRKYEYDSSVGDIALGSDDKLTGNWFLISVGFYADLL